TPGARDQITPGQTGFVFDFDLPDDFGRAMLELLDSRDRLPDMGARAREYALEHFQLDATIQAWHDMYRALLDAPAASPYPSSL
ncbi:MAG: hypothetical protein AAGB13_13475, partial [Cyanobacteria bacterium P01_F01_bin.33]